MASTKERLAALREYIKGISANKTTFIVEGDAFEYLRVHGAYTPDGRRIVLYPHPVEGVDGLSLSLYEMLDEAIKLGRLEFPDLESDDI